MNKNMIDTFEIGNKLLRIREERKMSQEKMADFLNYSLRHYRRMERDGVKSIDILNYIAAKLDVSPLMLLA